MPFRSVAAQARPPLKLNVQIILLPVPARPLIQDEETPIKFANEPFYLCAGDTHLTAHRDDLDTACFEAAAGR